MTVKRCQNVVMNILRQVLVFQKLLMYFNNLSNWYRRRFLNSIPCFISPGVHHFLWDDSCYAERNGFRCPLFVVPPYSWWTPVLLLQAAHYCLPLPYAAQLCPFPSRNRGSPTEEWQPIEQESLALKAFCGECLRARRSKFCIFNQIEKYLCDMVMLQLTRLAH